ncbi:MAG: ArsA family ATPase [Bacteroidota bacterium]
MTSIKPRFMFFAGKGGVGKSTVSALVSLTKSQNEKRTLLVSMDPAHNQSDIFKTKLGEKPKEMIENLWITQIDTDRWIKKYLRETEESVSKKYNYQKAFSIKNYFKVLQFSPGIEEYALMQAFEAILLKHQDKEAIIFDMPPTALTLRFFSLPHLTLTWINELTKLREKIYKKQEILSNIKFGKRNIETDSILVKLRKMKENYIRLNDLFGSEKTEINLVTKPDELSQSESIRIHEKLGDLGKTLQTVILNGVAKEKSVDFYKKSIPAEQYVLLPESARPLIGMENLRNYLASVGKEIEKI